MISRSLKQHMLPSLPHSQLQPIHHLAKDPELREGAVCVVVGIDGLLMQ